MHSFAILACTLTLGQAPGSAEALFEAKIRPVLIETCFKCHGGEKISSGLRVSSRQAILKGGEHGPAMIPGDPDKSLLVRALRHEHVSIKMPPGRRLPKHVAADFAEWIRQGAPWPASAAKGFDRTMHWAFQPVRNPEPPADIDGWSPHPIDRFISTRWRDRGLKPVGQATRVALLRRATFDLIGLPPTPDDVEKFLRDDAPGAFARVVDRLLASPQYGERWGRHWMDVVRYADTAGDNADYPIPEIAQYRDYIIDAFNADLPFDLFAEEQLAGDILAKNGPPEKFAQRVVATGFLALSRRYATAPYEFWHLTLEDAIDTTGSAFLGLTLRCARCHDHKFDPITREDYYGLYGIFAGTTFPYAGSEEFASMKKPREHFVPLIADGAESMKRHQTRLLEIVAEIKKLEQAKGPEEAIAKEKLEALRLQEKLWRRNGLPPDVPAAYAVSDSLPTETRIHLRGDPEKPGPIVQRRVPKVFEGKDAPAFPPNSSGRLELARWITRPDHPLTARVVVNRVWQYHFGRGIVATPNNFGLRGEPPTHPELLDHLATEFVKNGWSIKKLHRQIMLSRTYQLASTASDENEGRDPGNIWLWRFPRRRLDAEAIRDSLLAVSDNLDTGRPGSHPFPPIAKWNWTQHTPFKEVYGSNHRSVYQMTQRFQRHPVLGLFDAPDANMSSEKRPSSAVPLQALFFLNDPFVTKTAEQFARRLLKERPTGAERIERAYMLAFGRHAGKDEIARGVDYVRAYQDELKSIGTQSDRVELEAWTSYARVLLGASEFVFVD